MLWHTHLETNAHTCARAHTHKHTHTHTHIHRMSRHTHWQNVGILCVCVRVCVCVCVTTFCVCARAHMQSVRLWLRTRNQTRAGACARTSMYGIFCVCACVCLHVCHNILCVCAYIGCQADISMSSWTHVQYLHKSIYTNKFTQINLLVTTRVFGHADISMSGERTCSK